MPQWIKQDKSNKFKEITDEERSVVERETRDVHCKWTFHSSVSERCSL